MWQLKKEEIEDCNELQVKLLNSSWNLLRQYKLPDEYRLTQESLNGYYKAVNEADPSKRLRMLRARNVERNFQVYPPYWYYRAKAAQESGNDSEALSCWDKFAEVWRPVLRNDPYKLEEAKYRVQRLAANSEANREEIRRLLGVIQDNISAGDWSNNLFVGVAHSLMGDKDEGIACVEVNVDFGYEEAVSKTILAEMKKGELDAFTLFALQNDLRAAIKETKQEPESRKQDSTKRRELTEEEIIRVIEKYGYSFYNGNEEILNHVYVAGDYYISFEKNVCRVLYFQETYSLFSILTLSNQWRLVSKAEFLYNDLRNNNKTENDIRKELNFLPANELDKLVSALMELKAID